MNTERELQLTWSWWLDNQSHEYVYYKTTFELKESLSTANGYPSLEIVSTRKYKASDLEASHIDAEDARYGETYCIETELIKGFRQVSFDAKAYNQSIAEKSEL